MATPKYKFHSWAKGVDSKEAQLLGARISKIAGSLAQATPEILVTDARSPDSPLHRHFEWNDTKAAEQHRLQQAKVLLANLYIVNPRDKQITQTNPVLEVVSKALQDMKPRKVATPPVKVPPSNRQLMKAAHDELVAWAAKYSKVPQLKPATLYVKKAIGSIDTID